MTACSFGRKPNNGGIPPRDNRRNTITDFDWWEIFAVFGWVLREELSARDRIAEIIIKYKARYIKAIEGFSEVRVRIHARCVSEE